MRKENRIWINLFFFIIGILLCYIFLQFKLFKINLEINIINTIISLITAAIGVYIAISIQKRLNQGQNNYSFIKDKFENLWINFNSFSDELKSSNSLPLGIMTSYTKKTYSSIEFIYCIYDSFELDKQYIVELENKIDVLEATLNGPINQNIINLIPIKTRVMADIKNINEIFMKILKQISNI